MVNDDIGDADAGATSGPAAPPDVASAPAAPAEVGAADAPPPEADTPSQEPLEDGEIPAEGEPDRFPALYIHNASAKPV
jgi:hypothetical protein